MALVRKELIRADHRSLAGEGAFRFRHDLIRDAAYESLPKQQRARMHERYAAWLEGQVADRFTESEQILGFHLERAYRLCAELGPLDDHAFSLGQAAAAKLGLAGRRAFDRGDIPAACNLLLRAADLLSEREDDSLPGLKVALGYALLEAGRLEEADAVLVEAAAVASDEGLTRLVVVERTWMQMLLHPEQISLEQVRAEAEISIAVFTRLGDHHGLARSWRLLAEALTVQCRFAATADAAERAVDHARRAGDDWGQGQGLAYLSLALDCGPMPAAQAIKRCRRLLANAGGRRWEAGPLGPLAHLEAMQGRFPEARELIKRGRAIAEELRVSWTLPWLAWWNGKIECLAGDLAAAEREFRRGDPMDDKSLQSTVAADLAEVLHLQGRLRDALRFTQMSEQIAAREDAWSQSLWRSTRAKVLIRQGETTEAVRLAREAAKLAGDTDFLDLHAGALLSLAEVLRYSGQPHPELMVEAAELYRQKGNLPSLARVEALFDKDH